jgi:CDP-paratose 2-epimerase
MSCIYGERQFGVEDQGWLAWFVIATLTNQPISIYGDGKQVRDVLYVSDLVEAFASFIDNESKSNVFNMGGGPENSLSLLEALSLIEKAIGKKIPLVFKPWRSADQKVYLSDIAKAKKTLSWKPRTSPHAGIKKLFDWISTNIGLLK